MGGFSAGMTTGSVPLAVAGAIMGAIAGGIMGAINKRKEEYKVARAAGAAMAANVSSGLLSGVNSAVGAARAGGVHQTRTVAEQQLGGMVETQGNIYGQLQGIINTKDNSVVKAAIERGYSENQGPFAGMNFQQYSDSLEKPMASAEKYRDEMLKDLTASQTVQTIYKARMQQYEQLFGMTADQVFELAQTTGLNLMSATQSLDSAINQLVSGMINSTTSLNAFIGETYANMYDVVDKAKKIGRRAQDI
jgi:hypothetical protein